MPPSDTPPLIEVRALVNRFGENLVHDGLDLDVYRGEILGLVGGSGSGKSVLIRCLQGLHHPNAGRIRFKGRDLLGLSETERVAVEQRWGVLFQTGALFSSLSVLENVELPLREHLDLPSWLVKELAELKIRLAGLPVSVGDRYPAELSGGMVKRAALARALALDPELLFLDEPTAGLDPIAAHDFDELIRHLQTTLGFTVILITHDLDTLVGICDRIAVLVDRQLIVDTLEGLLQRDHPWIRAYFHGPRMRAAQGAALVRARAQEGSHGP